MGGTPWCVVWTGDAKTFFYNPTSKMSVWEKPPELENRADVDKMMSTTPPEVQNIRHQLTGIPPTTASTDGSDAAGDEPPSKKQKTDGEVGLGRGGWVNLCGLGWGWVGRVVWVKLGMVG